MKYFIISLLCLCILFPYDTLAQDDLDAKYATDMLKPGTKAPAILSMSNGKTYYPQPKILKRNSSTVNSNAVMVKLL